MRCLLLSALGLASLACGSSDPQVVVDTGPTLVITEGKSVRIAVDIADPPSGGACAPPFDDDSFEYVLESGAEFFDQIELEPSQGGVDLVVESRCDAVAPNQSDLLVPITIRSRSGCARDRQLTLQIRDSRGAECEPIVTAWVGDCAAPPAETSLTLSIADPASSPPVCVRFESRDPGAEDLWVGFIDGVPNELLDVREAANPSPIDVAQTVTLEVKDASAIKGSFDLDYVVSLSAPGQGAPATTGTIRLRVGSPGLSLSAPASPDAAIELDAKVIPVRLWRLDDEHPEDSTCLRASRQVPIAPQLERSKPFSRVENAQTGVDDSSDEVEWVCGKSFWVTISPPLDAPPQETIELEVNTCSSCDTVPTPTGTSASSSVTLDTVSVAGEMSCGLAGANNSDNAVVCANLGASTSTPDIVFRKRGGAAARTCIFAGDDEGRHELAQYVGGGPAPTPNELVSILWRGPTGPTPVVLGDFTGADIRSLVITPGSPPLAEWVPATDQLIASSSADLRAGNPFAQNMNNGVTHYAVPSGRNVELLCITANVADCQSLVLSNLAPVGYTVGHVGRADLDGDGVRDLIAFSTETALPNKLVVRVASLTWVSEGRPEVDQVSPLRNVSGSGGRLRSGAINREGCTTAPCRQLLYAGAGSSTTSSELIRVAIVNADVLVGTARTLSATRDLAAYRDRLIVGMEFGVSEALREELLLAWQVRDPVILEDRLVGPVSNQPKGYASSVAPCVDQGRPSVAFTSDNLSVRWTEMDIDVVLP